MLPPFLKQVYALSGSICIYFVLGYCMGLQGVLIPSLKSKDSEIPLSDDQISWTSSAIVLTQLLASMSAGIAADIFGRKIVALVSTIPAMINCVMIYFARNFITLLLANGMSGLIFGAILAGPMIVAEAVSPKYRGAMLVVKNSFWTIGLMTTHLLRNICYWRHMALYGLIPAVLGFILVLTMPESPAWLAKKGRYKDAKKSFEWFRGENDKEELAQLISSQEKAKIVKKQKLSMDKREPLLKFMLEKTFVKAFFVCILLFCYIEASTKRLFATFSSVFIEAIMSSSDNYTMYALAFDIIDIAFNLVAGFIIDRVGRRKLIFCCGIPSIVIGFLFSLVNYLCHNEIIAKSYSWLSMTFYILYFVPLSIGVVPTLTVLYGEIIPLSHRGVGLASAGVVYAAITFVVTRYTLTLLDLVSIHGFYFAAAVVSVVCVLVIYFMVPETNLKTLVDVENEMRGEIEDTFDVEMKKLMIDEKVNEHNVFNNVL